MSPGRYDIAIVGGGLAGASLACAVMPLGYRVAVIEAVSSRAASQPSYDDRTLALNHASCTILQGIGLWPGLQDEATPIREVVVTELDRPGKVRLRAAELGLGFLGQVVEARAFGAVVLDRLAGLDGVDWLCPARVTAVDAGEQAVRISGVGDTGAFELEASLLVAADGATSTVRGLLGIKAREKDYGQSAIICNVTPEHPHANRAFERMTPTGPFALLPHRGPRCGLVWCLPGNALQAHMSMDDEEFLHRATRRSGGALGALGKLGERSAYPLKLAVAERHQARRSLVLGNAAHTIHPVAAQGFNLALRDVAVLAEVLAGGGGSHPDAGAKAVLDAYSQWRRDDSGDTVAWTDGMVRLFSSTHALSGAARTLGLLAHSFAPSLRRRLASQAMGYRGRVPRLALGESLSPPGAGGA